MKPNRLLSGLWFRARRFPGVFRRFKLWFLLGFFLVLLLAAGPVVGPIAQLLADAARALGRLLLPVIDNKVGRFILVNAVILLALYFIYRRFKERGKRLLGSWALDRFLSGLLHLSAGRYAKAARGFERVTRVGRFLDLSRAVPVYPEILPDARIKLALCYRELGEVDKAMRSLELLKVKDLPPKIRRELAEAKSFVYALSDELMEETVDRELDSALEKDSGNRRLLRLKRDRAEAARDLATAIAAQRKLLKNLPRPDRPREKTKLAVLHARLAHELWKAGRLDEAIAEISRSRSHDGRLVLASLVGGDIAAERGDPRAAVAEWARVPSLATLDRVEKLLEGGALTERADLRFIAREFPCAGLLLILGEHYLRTGDTHRARNCVRSYERLGLSDRRSLHLLARILRAEGDTAAAERLEWDALKGFLGADDPGDRRPGAPSESL